MSISRVFNRYWVIGFVIGSAALAISVAMAMPFSIEHGKDGSLSIGVLLSHADGGDGGGGGDCCGSGGDGSSSGDFNPGGWNFHKKQPPSCDIDVSIKTIVKGETTTLIWESTNADDAFINHGIGNVPDDGSRVVSPDTTTTYTLTVSNDDGDEDCSVKVTVIPPPQKPSCTLSANPGVVEYGGSSTLTWTSTNGTSVSLDHGIGSVSKNGSHTVSNLTGDVTYTLTVTSQGGVAKCQTTIIVKIQQTPSCTIYANPTQVQYGGASTLVWTSTNATSASLNHGIGSVSLNGSRTVDNLTSTRTYTLTISGPGGTAQCSTTIVVEVQQMPTCSIYANPSSVQYGGSSTLSWTSTNGSSAFIDGGVGSVGLSGSRTVNDIYHTKTYTLTVYGTNGQSVQCQTSIYVNQVETPSCSIYANPTSISQGGSSYLSWSSSNATSAYLTNIGSVGVNGSQSVYPNTTTTYTLTVYGYNGQSAQCHTTIYVNTYTPGPSCWITLSNYNQYGYGNQATLSWGSTNATSAYISNIGSVAVSGSRSVQLSGYTQYTMTAYGTNGQSVTCRTEQYIPPVVPPYISLTQVPYTGLDLGPIGSAAYWLSILSLAVACLYLGVYYRATIASTARAYAKSATEFRIPQALRTAGSRTYGAQFADVMRMIPSKGGEAPRIVIHRS